MCFFTLLYSPVFGQYDADEGLYPLFGAKFIIVVLTCRMVVMNKVGCCRFFVHVGNIWFFRG